LYDWVFRISLVPHGDQIVAALADVLAVDDLAGEEAGQVEPVTKGRVGAK